MQGPYLAHPPSNAGLLLRGEDDAGMLHALTGQPEEVRVVGAQDTSQRCGPLQMVAVVISEHFKAVGRYNIQTACRQLLADRQFDALVKVEFQVTRRG